MATPTLRCKLETGRSSSQVSSLVCQSTISTLLYRSVAIELLIHVVDTVTDTSRLGQLEYLGNCLLKIITYSVDSFIQLRILADPITKNPPTFVLVNSKQSLHR